MTFNRDTYVSAFRFKDQYTIKKEGASALIAHHTKFFFISNNPQIIIC